MNLKELDEVFADVQGICGHWNCIPATMGMDINRVSSFVHNEVLRIGIMGECNTGKSTLVNAILGVDIVATGSEQGTTAIPVVVCKSDRWDFSIRYKNGEDKSHSGAKQQLLKKYMPQTYENTSWQERQLGALSDLLGRTTVNDVFFRLFTMIVSQQDENIDCVRLKCPTDRLGRNVELIDIPGFDMPFCDNYRSRALAAISMCDILIITVSPEKQINDELLNLLSNNVVDCQRIYFALTMVDSFQSENEICKYEQKISELITKRCHISDVEIIRCPSLLYLVNKGIISANIPFSQFSPSQRDKVAREFEDKIFQMFELFCSCAIDLKIERASKQMAYISEKTEKYIKSELDRCEKELLICKSHRTLPFSSFCQKYIGQSADLYQKAFSVLDDDFIKKCSSTVGTIESFMIDYVTTADTKSMAQFVFKSPRTIERIEPCEMAFYENYVNCLTSILNLYSKHVSDVIKQMEDVYDIKAIYQEFRINRFLQATPIRFRYSTWRMTTVPILRFLTFRSKINKQLFRAIRKSMNKTLEIPIKNYTASVEKNINSLNRQLENVYSMLEDNYSKDIQNRIKMEDANIEKLSEMVIEMSEDMAALKTLGQKCMFKMV